MSQRETSIEHRLHGLDLFHMFYGKVSIGALSTDDPHGLWDISAAFPVPDLFLADTGHSGGVADTERVVFIHHLRPPENLIWGGKRPLYLLTRLVYSPDWKTNALYLNNEVSLFGGVVFQGW